jgi:hypothetical protein
MVRHVVGGTLPQLSGTSSACPRALPRGTLKAVPGNTLLIAKRWFERTAGSATRIKEYSSYRELIHDTRETMPFGPKNVDIVRMGLPPVPAIAPTVQLFDLLDRKQTQNFYIVDPHVSGKCAFLGSWISNLHSLFRRGMDRYCLH